MAPLREHVRQPRPLVEQAVAEYARYKPSVTDLFLQPAELEALTGYKRGAEQVAWLRRKGWRFEQNAAGAPRVARAYFERRMVGEVSSEAPALPARHNFNALRVVK